jgi:hypothetical protein
MINGASRSSIGVIVITLSLVSLLQFVDRPLESLVHIISQRRVYVLLLAVLLGEH